MHYQGHKVKEGIGMGHVACMEKRIMHGRTLVGKPKGKRLLDRCRHKLEISLKELR
jgi:hypothetical protein